MKTRNGFVSNSSSSSYVIICPKSAHEKAIKKLHPYYRKWMASKWQPEIEKFVGKDIIIYSAVFNSEAEGIDWDGDLPKEAKEYLEDGGGVPAYDVIDIYIKELKKITKDVIFKSEGC